MISQRQGNSTIEEGYVNAAGRVRRPWPPHPSGCIDAVEIASRDSVRNATNQFGRQSTANLSICAHRPRADLPPVKIRRPLQTRRRWSRTCRCPHRSNRPAQQRTSSNCPRSHLRRTKGTKGAVPNHRRSAVPAASRDARVNSVDSIHNYWRVGTFLLDSLHGSTSVTV